jgi:protein-tyrosine phosphatase
MFRTFDPAAPSLDENPEHALDVDDPWYGGMRDFEVCLEQVEAAVAGLVEHLEREVSA